MGWYVPAYKHVCEGVVCPGWPTVDELCWPLKPCLRLDYSNAAFKQAHSVPRVKAGMAFDARARMSGEGSRLQCARQWRPCEKHVCTRIPACSKQLRRQCRHALRQAGMPQIIASGLPARALCTRKFQTIPCARFLLCATCMQNVHAAAILPLQEPSMAYSHLQSSESQ